MDLDQIGRFTIEVAEEAGQLLLDFFGTGSYQIKEDGSLQTIADVKSEELIRRRVQSAYPETEFFGEETNLLPTESELVWVCDPLDGTTNFFSGLPIWGVSIALMQNFKPLIGVVHMPLLGETVLAISGMGVTRNGKISKVRHTDGMQFSDIYTFCSWRSNSFSMNLPGNVRAFGSTAYHMIQFACGRTAGGWEESPKIWDIAAGILMVQEAGGIILSKDGNDIVNQMRKIQDIRHQAIPCVFAANSAVYNLMQQDTLL